MIKAEVDEAEDAVVEVVVGADEVVEVAGVEGAVEDVEVEGEVEHMLTIGYPSTT